MELHRPGSATDHVTITASWNQRGLPPMTISDPSSKYVSSAVISFRRSRICGTRSGKMTAIRSALSGGSTVRCGSSISATAPRRKRQRRGLRRVFKPHLLRQLAEELALGALLFELHGDARARVAGAVVKLLDHAARGALVLVRDKVDLEPVGVTVAVPALMVSVAYLNGILDEPLVLADG